MAYDCDAGVELVTCPVCDGSGEIQTACIVFGPQTGPYGDPSQDGHPCTECDGSGTVDAALSTDPITKRAATMPFGGKVTFEEATDEMIAAGERAYAAKAADMASPTPTEEYEAGGGAMGYAWKAMWNAATTSLTGGYAATVPGRAALAAHAKGGDHG